MNSNLKRSEHELSELNSIISDINIDARAIAPNLNVPLPQGTKKSPSPITQRLLMGVPKVYNLLAASSNRASSVSRLPGEPEAPEAHLKITADQRQSAGFQIPEAQPGQADN